MGFYKMFSSCGDRVLNMCCGRAVSLHSMHYTGHMRGSVLTNVELRLVAILWLRSSIRLLTARSGAPTRQRSPIKFGCHVTARTYATCSARLHIYKLSRSGFRS